MPANLPVNLGTKQERLRVRGHGKVALARSW
jgi:hypothetical protein